MSRLLHLFVRAALLVCVASPALAAPSKLDPLARRALSLVRSGASLERLEESAAAVSRAKELDVFVEGTVSRAELEAAGARVRTALPGVFTAYIPAEAVERVAALPGVARIRGAFLVEKQLDASVPTTGVAAQRGPGPDFAGLNGAGVLVGVVDTGIDYGHGDFLAPDGTTRLVGIWDQTDPVGPPPPGFTYGSGWTAALINSGVARQRDTDGHGTHVMGIAAGDGSATGGSVPAFTYSGMAPRADLVAVKTNFSTGVVDGVAYVMDRADELGKNAVVNLSLGTLYGPKDGTSPFESSLNALAGPGRIIVSAAGNSGGKPVHAEAMMAPGGTGTITLIASTGSAGARIAIDGYYESVHELSMTVTTPDGTVLGPVGLGGFNAPYPGTSTSKGRVYFENGEVLTATGDRQVYIELSLPDPNPAGTTLGGTWTFRFTNVRASGDSAEVDLWSYYASRVGANFSVGNRPDKNLVIEPANAPDVITPGAWVSKVQWVDCGGRTVGYGSPWTTGMLALFSSPGPTRDGRQKPDLVAPGIGIGAAQTQDATFSCPPSAASVLLPDGMQHAIMEGTSMAAPHVTGAVALLLQKYGTLTPDQVKSILVARAVSDSWTGTVWNNGWGWGKLHLGDLTDPTAQVTSPNGGETLVIGTTVPLTWSAGDAYGGVTAVDLELERSPGGGWEPIALGVPNTGSHDWTVSGPTAAQARLRVTARDAAQNADADSSDATFEIGGALAGPAPGAILDFALSLRSPSPGHGPVEIDFAVPREAALTLAVFDLAGRRIATLARGVHAAGRHRVRWERSDGQAGVYFVRLAAPGRELVRRVVVAG